MHAANQHAPNFDEAEVDGATDDGLDEGNDMVLDPGPHNVSASTQTILSAAAYNPASNLTPTALPFLPIGGYGARPPVDANYPLQHAYHADQQAFSFMLRNLPASTASAAPVGSSSVSQQQGSVFAGPSTGLGHMGPAPMAIVQPASIAGASTATLSGPSRIQSGGPDASYTADNFGTEAGGTPN
ncbi:hypothetical protein SEPCBS119000_000199 [Sporothrix epigloea]|uniref:Uncharacterized protein n=1 Tax=Sporothrix epigloea TaxID=1892477 RepID=A0ABP0D5F2_9PEZI